MQTESVRHSTATGLMMTCVIFLLCFTLACRTQPAKTTTPSRPDDTAPVAENKPAFTEIPVVEEGSNIAWLDSPRLRPVLETAQRTKQPVMVEFYASWCAPCKVMESEIFTQEQVFRYLNMNFLNFRTDIDSEAGQTIAAIYEVKLLPTILFLDPQGVVLARHTGIANPSIIRSLGDAALAKFKP